MMLARHCKLAIQRIQKPASRLIDHSVVTAERKGGQQCRTGRICERSPKRVQGAHASSCSEGHNTQLANFQARQGARYAGKRLQRQSAAMILSHAAGVVQRDDDLREIVDASTSQSRPAHRRTQGTKCIQKRSSSSGYQKQN